MEYKYRFSIVTAVYNTEEYIDEMIQSVLSQDIGIEYVQLILIDDHSTDRSLEICKKYAKQYPEHILVVQNESKGVSSARNTGLSYVAGKYINFLDSDDKLDQYTLSKVWRFFEMQSKKIAFVALPMYFFDQQNGEHNLNCKFKKDGVIDIRHDYRAIQLSSSSTFIRKDAIGQIHFDEQLCYAEDAKFLTEILLKTQKYAVMKEPYYYYRRRSNHSSAIQTSYMRREWYIDYIEKFSKCMVQNNESKYVQYIVMYDLQWRLNSFKLMFRYMDKKDIKKYMKDLKVVLKQISWEIIKQQKNLNRTGKVLAYSMKMASFITK